MMLKFIRNPLFPFIFQFITLIFFVALLISGFNNIDIATLLIWKFWWPVLIIITFFFGRFWCTVCPMELLNNLSHRLARFLRFKGISLPGWITAGWVIILFYLLLQISIGVFKVNKVASLTSLLFFIFFLTAIITGIIFSQPRAFCRGFCPAGILLKNYSHIPPFQIHHKSGAVCKSCLDKYCANPKYQDRFNNRSCPSFLKPHERWLGDDCNLCFQCLKICPYDNLTFGVIKIKRRLAMLRPLLLTAALYVFMESGFVLYELSEDTAWLEDFIFMPVNWLASALNIPYLYSYLKVGWYLLFLPFAFAGLFWFISRICKNGLRLQELIKRLAFVFLPIVASGHVAKAMIETNESLRIIGVLLVGISPLISMRYFKNELAFKNLFLPVYSGIIIMVSLYLIGIITPLL